MSEGAVWEAMSFASYYRLDNLVAIMDINRLGQSDPAPLQHHVEKYQKRCEAFGYWIIKLKIYIVEKADRFSVVCVCGSYVDGGGNMRHLVKMNYLMAIHNYYSERMVC